MSSLDNRPMFKELQDIQDQQREGWVPMPSTDIPETVEVTTVEELNNKFPPAVIGQPTTSGMSVLDKLCASLQQGDVAVVLTRPDLATLTSLVEKSWSSDDEFRILGKLKKMMEARCP